MLGMGWTVPPKLGVYGANVFWSDALPDANPTYSWTNEGFIEFEGFDMLQKHIKQFKVSVTITDYRAEWSRRTRVTDPH